MDHDVDIDTTLDEAGVRFADRDAALLRAVHEHGSLNEAAGALGRSYSRAQRRVVELEDAFGQLVERQRGGAGGGGSSLTETAQRLLAEFDRLTAEVADLAAVEETVLDGRVVARDGELGTVETDAGEVRAIVPEHATDVRLAVRADAITLHAADSAPDAKSSARNQFRGEVADVEAGESLARVVVTVAPGIDLRVLVTRTSIAALDLADGDDVVASFKATATRAYPADARNAE